MLNQVPTITTICILGALAAFVESLQTIDNALN